MRVLAALIAVLVLSAIPVAGIALGWDALFGIAVPYLALAVFLAGIVVKVLGWGMSPVPFRITTTTGQQRSLPWIRRQPLESPSTGWETFLRMITEIVLFRSLFRNTRADLKQGRIVHGSAKWLWLFGLMFHASFLVILLRHFKYFVEPAPAWVGWLQNLDGFFQVGLPIIYLTDVLFMLAVGYLLLRRVLQPELRYLSLAADYLPLFLLLGIAGTGVSMRYLWKVDIVSVKQLAAGLLSFSPQSPDGIGTLFYVHLFLVSSLLAYFPFSKLMHMAGVFLSPTRNLANNSRAVRHVNPWDYPVKVHTYAEYEDEFRQVMKAAGLPLEHDPDGQSGGGGSKPRAHEPAEQERPHSAGEDSADG
ncbi:MAG: hypothetical protein MAG453_01458 [Calditrichaeota bacterium]|nr:hypothetical protein [Calditrichota bacterium]